MTAPAADVTPVGRVLVVDDIAANRLLLRDLLQLDGYEVLEAKDGASAVDSAARDRVDVILLDVQMPVMDGLQACRAIRAMADTAAVPVLLVTALTARNDRIEGISAGANDFITKPIDAADLRLRVRNAMRLRLLHRQAEVHIRRLQELEQLRDDLVHMLVHDLRSPLMGVHGTLDLILMRGNSLNDDDASLIGEAIALTKRIAGMVSDVLDVARFEAKKMPLRRERVDLGALCAETVRSIVHREVRVNLVTSPEPLFAHADREIIYRVLANLLDNAVKFTPRDGSVSVSVDATEAGQVRISVRDTGRGIPSDATARVFEKFGQVSGARATRRSSGLGLAFCKLAVEAHDGRISVDSIEGSGSTFWLTLPRLD